MRNIALPVLLPLMCLHAAVVPPPWANPETNPCASQPRGWQLLHWPRDNKCYRIFTIGLPCPDTMELGANASGQAECRCPPKTAQSPRDANCYKLFTQGPCADNQYFAPVPETTTIKSRGHHWGTCRDAEACPPGQVFWPRDTRCHRVLSRGPCPPGELITSAPNGLATCQCTNEFPLQPYYSPFTQTCHEHYTRGPCEQQGHLFLPSKECGCNDSLPHFHQQTGKCFEIGSTAPCLSGQQFLLQNNSQQASCQCKPGLIAWHESGACYRPYTRGPCPRGQILFNATSCTPVPCRRGRLFFPDVPACYKVGTQGPCPDGQLVLFEPVRISVDGISHRGVCGCPNADGPCEVTSRSASATCDLVAGYVKLDNRCHKLYTQGPCQNGEWLVPDVTEGKKRMQSKCDCRPGYKLMRSEDGSELQVCQSPTVVLARFLNRHHDSLSSLTSLT